MSVVFGMASVVPCGADLGCIPSTAVPGFPLRCDRCPLVYLARKRCGGFFAALAIAARLTACQS